ncbi:GNAT family N-acetyltransferase [Mucilaginibacter daejeonensis]|uniref:GNAT family N-acetyltransferase n=1 Tax=Mucilaginibacter daejeonensis TaxID=398049 RepID=UPI001D17BD0E|nr:GNAT family N-acetyltransferase [Mucilaginibacter daejeonensis]UEG54287.1 GNAT family N-acetyltransferase [Mucilaginibacter daejeonensis]
MLNDVSIEQIRPQLTWQLRRDVLYPTEHLSAMQMEEDLDGWHFGAFYHDQLIGVVSLFQDGDSFQFRKFAVRADMQGQKVGDMMLKHLINFAVTGGGHTLWCNARLSATGFYLKAGFAHTGRFFSKNGFDYEILERPIP